MIKDYGALFDDIAREIRAGTDIIQTWQRTLEIAGISNIQSLVRADVEKDILFVAKQVELVFSIEPPPCEMKFLYFGLYEGDQKHILYISGGNDAEFEQALNDARVEYFPGRRRLHSELLAQVSIMDTGGETLNYLLPFAAAGVIAKGIVKHLGIKLPTTAGFDSGDFALVAN